jgi:transcriptional regulator
MDGAVRLDNQRGQEVGRVEQPGPGRLKRGSRGQLEFNSGAMGNPLRTEKIELRLAKTHAEHGHTKPAGAGFFVESNPQPLTQCKLRILGMGRKAKKNDSLPGSLDMLILRTLSRRDLHGYGIVQFIQQSSENELLVEEGSLYPALQRLELNGWIEGVWGVTSNNRRAKIYKVTAAGRKQLAVETRQYAKLTLAIARVMGMQ